jgi:hypothetical protein
MNKINPTINQFSSGRGGGGQFSSLPPGAENLSYGSVYNNHLNWYADNFTLLGWVYIQYLYYCSIE